MWRFEVKLERASLDKPYCGCLLRVSVWSHGDGGLAIKALSFETDCSSFAARCLASAGIVLCLLGNTAARADEKPQLLVETGRHSAPITSISASKDGSLIATSSADKTVRLWDAAGHQLSVIRPPDDR